MANKFEDWKAIRSACEAKEDEALPFMAVKLKLEDRGRPSEKSASMISQAVGTYLEYDLSNNSLRLKQQNDVTSL